MIHRFIQVRICIQDNRILSAHFRHHALHMHHAFRHFARQFKNLKSNLLASCKGNQCHIRMGHQSAADFATRPWKKIKNAPGQLGLFKDLIHHKANGAALRGGFVDDGVSCH